MIQRSPRRNRPSRRRGYALVLVCLFVVLFLSLLGVAWRQMASALRIASLQSIQQQSGNTSVFITKTGNPFLIRNIRSNLDRYFHVAGIENAKVNDLRHTFIAQQLKAIGTATTI